jgi:hypothetical protein
VSGATSEETASPASVDDQEDQAAAEHVPPTSPLLDEVKQGHPVREAIEDAEAERRAGGLGKPGRPLRSRPGPGRGLAYPLFLYHLVPHSRRTRVVLIGDEIFTKVGGYVLGNVITSFIAGAGTFLWMLAWGIPGAWTRASRPTRRRLRPLAVTSRRSHGRR